MTIPQIVIFAIILIGMVFFYVKIAYTIDEDSKGFGYMFALSVLIFMLAFIAITTTIEMNESHKALKGKCPEYELIDSVYRIKK